MTFSTEKFIYPELEDLRAETNLGEQIDYSCEFIVARRDNKIVGVVGINFKKTKGARLEHIIVAPEHQKAELGKSKLGLVLIIRAESWLRNLGYKFYNAFIFYDNKRMRHFAEKWGMVDTIKGSKGSWFFKELVNSNKEALHAMA